MANRTRNIVLRVPVTPEERALIQQKMAQLHTKNFSAYARKMLIDGYIVHMDTSDIRAQTAELQKIGVNVNQIARRINSTGTVYGMIDGIINNGPKEDKTAEVKAPERGEKSSIMDRLQSAKAEKQKECCPPQKHKGEIEL